jgi:hypothetical protein
MNDFSSRIIAIGLTWANMHARELESARDRVILKRR